MGLAALWLFCDKISHDFSLYYPAILLNTFGPAALQNMLYPKTFPRYYSVKYTVFHGLSSTK